MTLYMYITCLAPTYLRSPGQSATAPLMLHSYIQQMHAGKEDEIKGISEAYFSKGDELNPIQG